MRVRPGPSARRLTTPAFGVKPPPAASISFWERPEIWVSELIASSTVVKLRRSMSSLVMTVTGEGPSVSTVGMREPVTMTVLSGSSASPAGVLL
jgi:hypothetical protein